MLTREELKLCTDEIDLIEANTAAKDAYRADPNPKTKAAKDAAGLALSEFRTKWREVRDAFNDSTTWAVTDGVARPKMVHGKGR